MSRYVGGGVPAASLPAEEDKIGEIADIWANGVVFGATTPDFNFFLSASFSRRFETRRVTEILPDCRGSKSEREMRRFHSIENRCLHSKLTDRPAETRYSIVTLLRCGSHLYSVLIRADVRVMPRLWQLTPDLRVTSPDFWEGGAEFRGPETTRTTSVASNQSTPEVEKDAVSPRRTWLYPKAPHSRRKVEQRRNRNCFQVGTQLFLGFANGRKGGRRRVTHSVTS